MKIIASLTTIPSRINFILPTIESIFSQTIPIDSIEINIPYIFKRTGEAYELPEWLIALEQNSKDTKCKVKIFRTEDYGAITKVAPTLIRHKNSVDTYIWSVDDDFAYPENMLAVLYREFSPGKNRVLSHSGGRWKYKTNYIDCTGHISSRKEGLVEYLEGYATVLYPAFKFEDDFEDYIIKTSETIDCRNSDDIIISNYLISKGIQIYNCAYPYTILNNLLDGCNIKYSSNEDALHHQGGGNEERYIRVYNWLKDINLNAWVIRAEKRLNNNNL